MNDIKQFKLIATVGYRCQVPGSSAEVAGRKFALPGPDVIRMSIMSSTGWHFKVLHTWVTAIVFSKYSKVLTTLITHNVLRER